LTLLLQSAIIDLSEAVRANENAIFRDRGRRIEETKLTSRNGIEKIPDGDIKPYKSEPGCFRLRIGNHRILYKWSNDEQITVVLIESRGQVYKKGV